MKILNKMLNWLYPKHIKCIFCGNELNEFADNDTCVDCFDVLPYIKNPCSRCGGEMPNESTGVCFDCKKNNYEFSRATCAFNYTGCVVKTIRNFKYKGMKFLYEPLGGYICSALSHADFEFDIVTYVPMHYQKQKHRKYNQAELLADYVAKQFNVPLVNVAIKTKDNGTQTALGFVERQKNVKNTFEIIKQNKHFYSGKRVLLVDDVFTTGATTSEVSRLLKAAGAREVNVLTIAHTMLKNEL